MFKSCGSLFDLSRKLGSVVGGLGLAGVLFAGQVSATGGFDSIVQRFTPDDDARLMELVREYGENQWGTIARLLNARKSARQCRDRYRNYLQPRNRVPLPISQTNTALADSTPTPITANGNQNAVNTTNTSNAATQSGQVLPFLPGPFPNININIFLNR